MYVPAVVQNSRDAADISRLLTANADHPGYGYRRLQIRLKWSASKTRRLMAMAAVVPLGVGRKQAHAHKETTEAQAAPDARCNLLKKRGIVAAYLHHIWAEDFTYLWFQGRWYYLATVIDLYSRQIVGWTLGDHHDTDLVTSALLDALSRHTPPAICHQDQGSEYCSERYDIIALSLGIELSFSGKGHPWENGFQESFYRYFKLEIHAKKLDRFVDLGGLSEAIAKQMRYYNMERIHSALGMSPLTFATTATITPLQAKTKHTFRTRYCNLQQMLTGVRDKVFGVLGA
jgi:putative transposase